MSPERTRETSQYDERLYVNPDSGLERPTYNAETLRRDLDTLEAKHGMTTAEFLDRSERGQLPVMSGFDAHVWRGTHETWLRMSTATHMRWRPIILALTITLTAALAGIVAVNAYAREGAQVKPIRIPEALEHARAVCPDDNPVQCRSALRRAYDGLAWAKKERIHTYQPTVNYAIALACTSQPTLDCGWFKRMIHCESKGDPRSKNRHSTAAGLAQFLDGTWSGNLYGRFDVFDPIANALGAAWLAVRNGHAPWYASRGCWG